jgi:hypothetical protein
MDIVGTPTPNPRLTAAAALTFVAALTIACGSSSPATPTPTLPTPTPSATVAPSPTPAVRVGARITPADASTSLPMLRDNSHYWFPDGGYGAQIVVASFPSKGPGSETEGSEYSLWDPATGSITPEWTDAPGLQETYTQSDGDWLETVTRGFGGTAAMADWTIILRNLKTGEKRDIAKASPADIGVVLSGDRPAPSINDGKVVWVEGAQQSDGTPELRVQLYDIQSDAQRTVFEATDLARETVSHPSIGSGKVVWVSNSQPQKSDQIVTHDLATGAEQTIDVDSQPLSLTLSPAGRFLAWDTVDGQGAYDKHLLNLITQEQTVIATEQGYGVYVTDRYLSWDTANTGPGYVPSGLYDLQTNELRSVAPETDIVTNVAHVMGDWLVWQSMPLDPTSSDQGKWYALPLPG